MAHIHMVRKSNLQDLLDKKYAGNMDVLANVLGFKRPYLQRFLSNSASNRLIGAGVARNIEIVCGLTPLSLDEEQLLTVGFVLLSVEAHRTKQVLKQLSSLPEVVEAYVVFGDMDIIVKIVADSEQKLDEIIYLEIQEKLSKTNKGTPRPLFQTKTYKATQLGGYHYIQSSSSPDET